MPTAPAIVWAGVGALILFSSVTRLSRCLAGTADDAGPPGWWLLPRPYGKESAGTASVASARWKDERAAGEHKRSEACP
ncbi:hypothetical protein PLESTM_000566500 [Pleodorina starrii]|nr:hypothetical protein PLESTM_000566500 [Pleodorina starrii]